MKISDLKIALEEFDDDLDVVVLNGFVDLYVNANGVIPAHYEPGTYSVEQYPDDEDKINAVIIDYHA